MLGFRIELGKIENCAAKFPEIVHAIAEVKKNKLVLYYTSAKIVDEAALRQFLSKTLADYMISAVFVCLEAIPMTPSGKIDRKLLPTPNFSVRQSKYEPPINEIERKICSAFAKVLGLDENSVGRNDDFYFLGGDSIKSMIVMLTAGVDGLSAKDIFKNKTARRISEEISTRKHKNIAEFEFQARKKEIPVSAAQIQMIDYQFLKVNSTMYNLSGFYRLDAKLNAEKLAKAVEKVANHHPALNSVFDFDDEGNIVQKIRSFSYFLRPNSSGMHFMRFNFDVEKVIFVCYNGISEMADAISVNIVELFMNLRLMKLFGEVGVAAFGVFSYVNEVFLSIFFALSTATVTLVGFNYGRRNFSEIRSLIKKISAMTITFGVLMTACATIFSEEIAKIYVGYDENAYKMTITVLKTCSLMFLLYGFNLFVSAFFTGMEKSTLSAIIAFMQSLIMPIFFILLLPELFGANSIWFSTFFATLMTAILALRLLLKHFRRKKLA